MVHACANIFLPRPSLHNIWSSIIIISLDYQLTPFVLACRKNIDDLGREENPLICIFVQ